VRRTRARVRQNERSRAGRHLTLIPRAVHRFRRQVPTGCGKDCDWRCWRSLRHRFGWSSGGLGVGLGVGLGMRTETGPEAQGGEAWCGGVGSRESGSDSARDDEVRRDGLGGCEAGSGGRLVARRERAWSDDRGCCEIGSSGRLVPRCGRAWSDDLGGCEIASAWRLVTPRGEPGVSR
jgi:hypothetical protein